MDYYEILGVEKNATPETIKQAHRALSKKYHPDVNDAQNAATFFRLIQEAYETLSDAKKRSDYDNPINSQSQTAQGNYDEPEDSFHCFYHPWVESTIRCPECGKVVCLWCRITILSDGACAHCCGRDVSAIHYSPKPKRNILISILIFPFVMILKLLCCILFVLFKFFAVLLTVIATIATVIGGIIMFGSVLLMIAITITVGFDWIMFWGLLIFAFFGFLLPHIAFVLPVPFLLVKEFMGAVITKRF